MKFSLQGKLYKFICLPNGLCFGLRKFTKLIKPLLFDLRLDYVIIVACIDDLITLAHSFDICFNKVWKSVKCLVKLGFVVHP